MVSLDAEKAFDRVKWGYLYEAMARFGLGDNFILWVRLLYSSLMASVQTNDMLLFLWGSKPERKGNITVSEG